MTANPPPLTPTDVLTAFGWLEDVGLELPPRLSDDARLDRATVTYADELADARVTPDELTAALRTYVRRRLDHGGRRPWPDVGMLLDAVREVRVAARPVFGEIREPVWAMIGAHFGAPLRGFDASGLPVSARDIAVEACVAAGVSSRGGEEPRFVMRDVEREYEARRVRA